MEKVFSQCFCCCFVCFKLFACSFYTSLFCIIFLSDRKFTTCMVFILLFINVMVFHCLWLFGTRIEKEIWSYYTLGMYSRYFYDKRHD